MQQHDISPSLRPQLRRALAIAASSTLVVGSGVAVGGAAAAMQAGWNPRQARGVATATEPASAGPLPEEHVAADDGAASIPPARSAPSQATNQAGARANATSRTS